MKYSIFDNTLADMNYQDIEKAAKGNSVVLFPISVIEEHGPHLPLATDTYIAYRQMVEVRKNLSARDIKAVIVPPFYWGINVVTSAFPGSFSLKKSTMIDILKDILFCLQKWSFRKVFTCECHGDCQHNTAILEAFKLVGAEGGIDARFILSENDAGRFNSGEYDKQILMFKDNTTNSKPPKYMDVHAGKYETSLMMAEFPDTVNTKMVKKLKPTKVTPEDFLIWRQGGENNREMTPLGYCGDPANIDISANKAIFELKCCLVSETIYRHLSETF